MGHFADIDFHSPWLPAEGMHMYTTKIVYWQDDNFWIGYLQDYPDYMTQGETLDELKEHLKDLYDDISGGHIPGIRRVDELVVS